MTDTRRPPAPEETGAGERPADRGAERPGSGGLLTVRPLEALPDLDGLRPGDPEPGGRHALEEIITSLPVTEFLGRHWGRDCHLDPGDPADPGRFHRLLPWPELDRLLDGHRAWPLRMQVARGNASLPPSSYLETIPGRGVGREPAMRVSSAKLHARLREGATLVFGSVDEAVPEVRKLAERLEHDLRAEVFVNLYASWGQVGAFDPHWDDHDGIILQVYGRKEWRLYGVGRPVPLPGDGPLNECPPRPLREFELTEGQALYVPRGHWHAVRPVGGTTVHLTFGIRRPVVRDLLRWAVDRQLNDPDARFDLPLGGWDDELAGRLSRLLGGIGDLLGADGFGRYVAERDGRAAARPRHLLPHAVTDLSGGCPPDAVVVLAAPRPVARGGDGRRLTLLSGGLRYDFDARCEPLLRRLLGRRPWRAGDLAREAAADGGPDADECRRLVAELLGHGLLRFGTAPAAPAASDRPYGGPHGEGHGGRHDDWSGGRSDRQEEGRR
ncbi:cupin domain-containing protein [Streptosporangium sp. NPDC048047]|uniref:JmjC domain-containing protein n=1 Tax=Streptosporangium sp. NPDC048047 TaxID=3155748 RepID=UPI00342CC51C